MTHALRISPTETQSINENAFECFAGSGVNKPRQCFQIPVNFDFSEAQFRPVWLLSGLLPSDPSIVR